MKYWKKVVFNIIGRMVLNAYIIYSENYKGKKLTRFQFVSSIIDGIEKEWFANKNNAYKQPISSTPNEIFSLEKLPGRNLRRCVKYNSKYGKGVKRSNLICSICKKGIHALYIANYPCKR